MLSWDNLWQAYAEALRLRGLSGQTLTSYGRAWRRFVAWAPEQGLGEPRQVVSCHLERYAGQLLADPRLSSASALALVRPVLRVLAWAAQRGLLLLDPGQGLTLQKTPRPAQDLLSLEQVGQLLEAPFQGVFGLRLRDRAVLELLYGTGLRGGELVGLDLFDLDLAQAVLAVRRGKSRKERRLPLGDHSRAALSLYVELARPRLADVDERALFVSRRGRRLKACDLYTILNRYGQALGLERLHPHALRRAFASHMLENGADLAQLKLFLGHADVRSTQLYTLLRPVQLEATYRETHPRARRRRPSPEP